MSARLARSVRASARRLPALILAFGLAAATVKLLDHITRARSVSPAGAELMPYAPARWRLVPYARLHHSVIWLSHVLIAIQGSASFPHSGEDEHEQRSARSVEDGRALAVALAKKLKSAPDTFGALAEAYSDDAPTRALKGKLGGVRASQLPREYLDALAKLKAGEISRPFRTIYGYSIIKRELTPREEFLTGQRLLFPYKGRVTEDGPADTTERAVSRVEAVAAALRTADRIRRGDANFDELHEAYSPGEDVPIAETWSTLDPGFMPVEVQALSELSPAQISAPIDSRWGIELIRRDPDSASADLVGMIAVRISFSAVSGIDEGEALARAMDIIAQSRRNPAAFDEALERYCCPTTHCWRVRAGPRKIEPVVAGLKIGEIGATPVRLKRSYLVIRRVEPNGPRGLNYELPSPDRADLDAILAMNSGPRLAFAITKLRERVRSERSLNQHSRIVVDSSLAVLSDRIGNVSDPGTRRTLVSQTWSDAKKQLTEFEYNSVDQFISDWIVHEVLGGSG